jgi:hypothetical protein
MTHTDEDLRQALRRVEPPAGFTERVVARALKGHASLSGQRGPAWSEAGGSMARWAAAAVLAVAVTGGVWYRAELRREAEGEAAGGGAAQPPHRGRQTTARPGESPERTLRN